MDSSKGRVNDQSVLKLLLNNPVGFDSSTDFTMENVKPMYKYLPLEKKREVFHKLLKKILITSSIN